MKSQVHNFILVSESMDGAFFAKILQDEGNNVLIATKFKENDEFQDKASMIMDGVVEKVELDDIFKDRKDYKDYLWIWDLNFASDMADQLREEGFMVLGGQKLSDTMEHDRAEAISIVEKAGLQSPEYHEFSSAEEGMDFLEQNPDKAFVLKPDEPDEQGWVTTVPNNTIDEKANREMYSFLQSAEVSSSYILQERKKGVEINIEVWLYKGKAFFAHGNFECKQKLDGDMGKQCGCAGDVEFILPLETKIVQDTVMKIAELKEFRHYTGPLDFNCIVGDNQYWFLEFCDRFGYNATPNLLMNLSLVPLSEIFTRWESGDVSDFYSLFRRGFGASITLRTESKASGLPVMIEPESENDVFHFSTYDDDGWKTTGYMEEVLIAMGNDYDLQGAFEKALETANNIHFGGKFHRTDLGETGYPSSPLKRYQASVAIGLFDKTDNLKPNPLG